MTGDSFIERLETAVRDLRASRAVERRGADFPTPAAALGGPERGRFVAAGRRRDDDWRCDLVVVWERDGSWTFHAPGSAGVTLSRVEALVVAESIIGRCGGDR